MIIQFIIVSVGIFQLPLLIDLLSNLFPSYRFGRLTQTAFSALLVALMAGLCLAGLFVYFYCFLPYHLGLDMRPTVQEELIFLLAADSPKYQIPWMHVLQLRFAQWFQLLTEHLVKSPVSLLNIAIALFLWLNTIANYVLAVAISPLDGSWAILGRASSGHSAAAARSPQQGPAKSCKVCSAPQPSFTHHCTVCKACIPYFDHHCPFTMNCVSLHTSVYFNSFLVYVTLGLLFAAYMSYAPFVECSLTMFRSENRHDISPACSVIGDRALAFLPVLVIGWCTLLLVLWQGVLFLVNLSNYELLGRLKREPLHWTVSTLLPMLLRVLRYRLVASRLLLLPFLLPTSYVSSCLMEHNKVYRELGSVPNPCSRFFVMIQSRKPNWYSYLLPIANPANGGLGLTPGAASSSQSATSAASTSLWEV